MPSPFPGLNGPGGLLGHTLSLICQWLLQTKTLKPGGTFALTQLSLHCMPPYDSIAAPIANEGILVSYDGLKLPIGN